MILNRKRKPECKLDFYLSCVFFQVVHYFYEVENPFLLPFKKWVLIFVVLSMVLVGPSLIFQFPNPGR